ncbi:MAG: phenylacetic acid degradation protein PaaN, partial [bacterium]
MPVDELITRHQQTLDDALAAIRSRAYFSAYPESPSPKIYGENAAPEGVSAYEAHLGRDFPIDSPGSDGRVATERSPFGPDLGIRYPRVRPD